MNSIKKSTQIVVAVVGFILLAACAGKAQSLRTGSTQFEIESLAAIDAIDEMRRLEIAPNAMSSAEQIDEFVTNALTSNNPANQDRIELWMNSNVVSISTVDPDWTEFLGELRGQYAAFAGMFDQLENASFFARNKVPEATPYVRKLTAQLLQFANVININPPRLLQRRSALIVDLDTIRNDAQLDEAAKRTQISRWHDRWLSLVADEEELRRRVVEQCIKAAIIGREIERQIVNYNKLSLGDISEGIRTSLQLAGDISGQDFSDLQSRTDAFLAEIQNDPDWKRLADAALTEVNGALAASRAAAAVSTNP